MGDLHCAQNSVSRLSRSCLHRRANVDTPLSRSDGTIACQPWSHLIRRHMRNVKTCQLLTNTPGIERRFTSSRGCGEEGNSCVVWMMFAGYSHCNPALMQWLQSGCLSLHLILRRLQLWRPGKAARAARLRTAAAGEAGALELTWALARHRLWRRRLQALAPTLASTWMPFHARLSK